MYMSPFDYNGDLTIETGWTYNKLHKHLKS